MSPLKDSLFYTPRDRSFPLQACGKGLAPNSIKQKAPGTAGAFCFMVFFILPGNGPKQADTGLIAGVIPGRLASQKPDELVTGFTGLFLEPPP